MNEKIFFESIVDNKQSRINFSFCREIYIPSFIIDSLRKSALIDFDLSVECINKFHPVVDLGYVQKPKKGSYGFVYKDPWLYGFSGYSKSSFKTGAIRKHIDAIAKEVPMTFYAARIPFATKYGKNSIITNYYDSMSPDLVTHRVKFLKIITVDNRTGGFIDVV